MLIQPYRRRPVLILHDERGHQLHRVQRYRGPFSGADRDEF